MEGAYVRLGHKATVHKVDPPPRRKASGRGRGGGLRLAPGTAWNLELTVEGRRSLGVSGPFEPCH